MQEAGHVNHKDLTSYGLLNSVIWEMFYLFLVILNVSEPNLKSKREYISAYKRK